LAESTAYNGEVKYFHTCAWLPFTLWLSGLPTATADTFSHHHVNRKLTNADLVAEVLIVDRTAHAHPIHYTVTHAEALVERVLEQKDDSVKVGDRIVIEALGGERGGVGVHISGYPRPYKHRQYLAHLNRKDGVFAISGFHQGLKPLSHTREYTRNRTDGTNGEGDGPFLRWDPEYFPIPYFIDAESFRGRGDFLPAIDAAFQSWRAPKDIRVEFVAVGCTNQTKVENDGINNVILQRTGWTFDADAIAINRSFYVAGSEPRAGVILDSDIILNGQGHSFTTTNQAGHHDVQNIMTHEVGHLLGLGHEIEPRDNDAAMYPFANPNETNKRTLSANDLAGVRSIYEGVGEKVDGASSMAMCEIPSGQTGCAGIPLHCSTSASGYSVFFGVLQWALLLIGIPIARWWRVMQPNTKF
jgi:hypothetical protein